MPDKEPFFTRVYRRIFSRCLDAQIYHQIFPHLRREKDYGYSFRTKTEMNAESAKLDVQAELDNVAALIRTLPDSYGASFRYIMHDDLCERLRWYAAVAERHVQRPDDPRLKFMARALKSAE